MVMLEDLQYICDAQVTMKSDMESVLEQMSNNTSVTVKLPKQDDS